MRPAPIVLPALISVLLSASAAADLSIQGHIWGGGFPGPSNESYSEIASTGGSGGGTTGGGLGGAGISVAIVVDAEARTIRLTGSASHFGQSLTDNGYSVAYTRDPATGSSRGLLVTLAGPMRFQVTNTSSATTQSDVQGPITPAMIEPVTGTLTTTDGVSGTMSSGTYRLSTFIGGLAPGYEGVVPEYAGYQALLQKSSGIRGAQMNWSLRLDPAPVVSVPGDFVTIQAAIDATPAGFRREIVVASGTHAGPIRFDGKDVLVRGSGASACTIDGTGGQASAVVCFSGGEPATAGIQGLTIRGGTTGSPIPQAPQFLVGGGLFANESAAFAKDCTFETNRAGYGGGIYARNSSCRFERCTVRSNTALENGGGMLLLNSQCTMVDCNVTQNSCRVHGGGMHVLNGRNLLTNVSLTSNQSGASGQAGASSGGLWFVYSAGGPTTELRLVGCSVTDNQVIGTAASVGGIRIQDSDSPDRVVLLGTSVCGNLPAPNISGPWRNLGTNTVCDCPADLNRDGFVDGADLGGLLGAWGACGPSACPADLNADGFVDGGDLGGLLNAWGTCSG